jgi:hypothetical protein
MKKPTDIQGLADRLSGAAAIPVGAAPITVTESRMPRAKSPNRGTASVFLRLSPELFAKLDAEAVSRTKATGRGVTVQQVILDKLEGIK